jgi:hypothetical protein
MVFGLRIIYRAFRSLCKATSGKLDAASSAEMIVSWRDYVQTTVVIDSNIQMLLLFVTAF